MFQRNYIHFGREAIERGLNEPPFAWIVPADQPDPGRTYEMLWRLRATAIEIHRATSEFDADGVTYPAGSYILYCAQPYRPHLMDMMERQVYPDRVLYPGGPAEPPYDMAGWTLPLQMGVEHVAVRSPFECAAERVDEISKPRGTIHGPAAATHFVVPAGRNDDFRLRYRLHAENVAFKIYTGEETFELAKGVSMPPGSLVLKDRAALAHHMEGLLLDVYGVMGLPEGAEAGLQTVRPPRAALYQPWTASMDEGWTRLVLESHEVVYTTIHNAEIRAGNLHDRYDCIVLPSLSVKSMINGASPDTTFPEFVGGIGKEGVVSLQDFVLSGGTLVCIDNASNLPIDYFNVPVRNIVAGLETSKFYCPGSVLRLWMDTRHPLGYGMPAWYSGYFARSQAFALGRDEADEKDEGGKKAKDRGPETRFPSEVVSRFSDTVLLESGWIRGGDLIADQPAIVEVAYGKGRIDLLGFGVQRRGQPHGTFRILFNAIARSTLGPILNETPRN